MKSYKDLTIWKKAMDIAEETYLLTQTFPQSEIYGLTSQMQRASVSIPSNIAEGYNRTTTKDYVQFLHISKGTCAELETQLLLSCRLGYTSQEKSETLFKLIEDEQVMLDAAILRHKDVKER